MRRRYSFDVPTLLLYFLTLFCSLSLSIHAQAAAPTPITQSGLNTQVSQPLPLQNGGSQYNITGGTRPGGGNNLFHSFGNFNVPTNNIANFLNDSGLPTSNILGRVTGGNASIIFGMIQTTNFGTANLFLMNPSGFLFGPNATLNVGGMAAFTTADYLRFQGSQTLFNNASTPDSLGPLSIAPVAAFGFLGSNPAAIAVQGSTLTVAPGQSISLVGGNRGFVYTDPDTGNPVATPVPNGLTITGGKLVAPGGQVNLASVASPGEVLAGTLNYASNVNGQFFGALGSINVSQQSVIDASGNGGGTVLIRGGNFVLDSSTISANATGPDPVIDGGESIGHGIDIQVSQDAVIRNAAILETNVLGNVTPGVTYGGVQIQADHIEIAGILPVPAPLGVGGTGIRSNVGTDAQPNSGNSGNISLSANSITMKGDAILETNVQGIPQPPGAPAPTSKAGDITLTANNNIELNGTTIQTHLTFDSGSAGNITLTSKHGSILETGNSIPFGFVPTPGAPIPPLTLNLMFNQSLSSAGKPGNYTFNAPEGNIQIAGGLIGVQIAPVIPGTPVQGAGGGQVNITANNLGLINFSSVQMDNFSGSPVGNFNVTLNGNLMVNSSRIITTARAAAPAAALNIAAHDVLVTHGSLLSTETQSAGNAGHLTISADTLQVTDGGRISSGTVQPPPFLFPDGSPPIVFPPPTGGGGTITVQGLAGSGSSASSVLVDGAGSGIFTNTVGTGVGGNTTISAQSVTIQNSGTISAGTSGTAPSAVGGSINVNTTSGVTMTNGGSITASSTGPANAGNIFVNAGSQLVMQDSSIKTEAAQAGGGNIEIQAGNLVKLGNSTVSTSVLGGGGSGGNITIDPNSVILQNSQILAQAVQGSGGNINIITNLLLPDSTSIISASSQFGQQGNVVVQSPISPAGGKIVPMSQKPLIATTLLGQRCAALAGGNISSFTVAGRDALPVEPGSWMSSPLAFSIVESEDGVVKEASAEATESESEEAAPLISLRRIAPSGFLTQNFAVETDCAS